MVPVLNRCTLMHIVLPVLLSLSPSLALSFLPSVLWCFIKGWFLKRVQKRDNYSFPRGAIKCPYLVSLCHITLLPSSEHNVRSSLALSIPSGQFACLMFAPMLRRPLLCEGKGHQHLDRGRVSYIGL